MTLPREQLQEDLDPLQVVPESMEDIYDALRGQLEGFSGQSDHLTEGAYERPIEDLIEPIEKRVLVFDAMNPQISGSLGRIV